MAFINVAEWSPDHVAEWLKGLDDCILPYVHFFLNNQINGCRLLLLSSDDLNNLNVTKIGHQELVLEAVDLLKHLHYNFTSETLQALALRLGCKSRSLYNQLKHDDLSDDISKMERVSTDTLSGVSDILACVKNFISWIDRYPFEGQDQYIPVRKTILRLSIELASTAQRDQFVDKPNDVIKTSCITLSELCDRIVQELTDSLAIQSAVLDIVTVKKKPDEELGMHIHSSYSGIHIVGGIKFQSPCHRCGRIEEGDEIVQVSYQTVVGWQLKKLVNTMKEHPTEILLTIKKRPRHSNIMGQVTVLKPYKIPARKGAYRSHGLSNGRVKNAATTTVDSEDDDDAFLPDDAKHPKQPKGPVYPLHNRRPKLQVRRRATISGASPTTGQPPIRIEDLVIGMANKRDKKDFVGRSISHDPAKYLKTITRGISMDVPLVPNIVTNKSTGSASPKLPYAKVHPIPIEDNNNTKPTHCVKQRNEHETTPKRVATIQSPKNNQKDLIINNKKLIIQNPNEENQTSVETNKISVQNTPKTGNNNIGVVSPSPVTVSSYQLISDIQPRSNSSNDIVSPKIVSENRPKPERELHTSDAPVLRPRSKGRVKHSSRRISCKDLGEGDCNGWLYQRKDQHGFLVPSSRWTKRWVVLKNNYLYCYKDVNELKAECLIHLPGFTVSPTVCKSKKNAFKLYNPQTAFHFASDTQSDMSKWMNKMGLAAISYVSHSEQPQAFCYSETEGSDTEESPSINRTTQRFNNHGTATPSSMQYRETSPGSVSTSSSDTNNSIKRDVYGRSPLSSTSSSSTSTSSFHESLRMGPKPAYPNAAKPSSMGSDTTKSPKIQPRICYLESSNSLDHPDISSPRLRRQLNDGATKYAKIIFPTPSSVKGSFSPQIPPRGPKLSLSSNLSSDSGSLDRQRINIGKEIAPGIVSKVTGSFNNLQHQETNVNVDTPKCTRPVPPRPQPRTSKLKRENVLPGYVAKITDSFDKLTHPNDSIFVNDNPESPRLTNKVNASKGDTEGTYEYAFKPTMAMIKTGIVNPLYDRVHNRSWSGHNSLPRGNTGKSPMPLPNEINACQRNFEIKKSPSACEGLSLLDREYNRLFGDKSPAQLNSPPPVLRQSPTIFSPGLYPLSATSLQIENLYTSKPRTVPSSVPHRNERDTDDHLSPQMNTHRKNINKFGIKLDRPQTPSSSDNSMSSSSGISSYYSTYLEIPAEQMHQIMNVSHGSTSSYKSAKSSPPLSATMCQNRNNVFDIPSPSVPLSSSSPETSSKPNKSPTKSSSFRLFSSPKLLKKLSTPKYQKERHHEKRDVNKIVAEEKSTKTGRLFLGSPKLTRAIFGSSKKRDDSSADTKTKSNSGVSASCQTDESFVRHSNLNRSSSDSSVTSNAIVPHHHIIEKRINKPQLTIALPLLTESSPGSDSLEMPLTPETPRKPTMGVAMIGKRRPSNVGSEKGAVESALQQYYGSGSLTNPSSCSSRTGYSTEDTDDEWANIVRTIEQAGLTLEGESKDKQKMKTIVKPIDDEQLCHLVLSLRSLQRTLRDKKHDIEAIDELLNQSITLDMLEEWIQKHPHLLPREYYP